MNVLLYFIIALAVAILTMQVVIMIQNRRGWQTGAAKEIENLKKQIDDSQSQLRQEISNTIQSQILVLGELLQQSQQSFAEGQKDSLETLNLTFAEKQQMLSDGINKQISQLQETFETLQTTNEQKLDLVRESVSKGLQEIQRSNEEKLNNIQQMVDEKLQKTLEEKMNSSFRLVSERLEQVYKGLGEMQNIASGVGDLKKVLSNVKSRGIVGEIQLGAILEDILTPDQYDKNVATIPNSTERVEYAIKLPGQGTEGNHIYLPIDSKFPGDTYSALKDAYESGDPEQEKAAYSNFERFIKQSARDIQQKYVFPPYTTNFAILFVPFEGLYAEIVRHNLIEVLQREYNINIAGPSTMAALLNSLQMGFRTLQIQKRSNEVWSVLGAVKSEFDKFHEVFVKTQKKIQSIDKEMDQLIGRRSNAIRRKLNDVQTLNEVDAQKILQIDATTAIPLDDEELDAE